MHVKCLRYSIVQKVSTNKAMFIIRLKQRFNEVSIKTKHSSGMNIEKSIRL